MLAQYGGGDSSYEDQKDTSDGFGSNDYAGGDSQQKESGYGSSGLFVHHLSFRPLSMPNVLNLLLSGGGGGGGSSYSQRSSGRQSGKPVDWLLAEA